jgi:hypothetical protein
LTLRGHLAKNDWEHRALLPVLPANLDEWRRRPVVREHLQPRREVKLFGSKDHVFELGTSRYWEAIEEIALQHLLACLDRNEFEPLWTGPLDAPDRLDDDDPHEEDE